MRINFKKFLAYALILAVIFLPGSVKYYRLYRQKQLNERRLKALIQENMRLAEETKNLREDPVYIEQMARENLGLAKKNEYVVKFTNQQNTRQKQKPAP